jgi:ligand-binding sensor domain-containing protein
MKFDKGAQTWIKYTKEEIPLSDEVPWITEVRRLVIDGNEVWFATNGGVLRYNKESDTWTHFTKSSGLPGHRALFVEVDAPEKIWVAFHGGVASYYDKGTGAWHNLPVTRAGVGTNIEAIAFTEKYVWFSTGSTGIRRYDRATKEWISYTEAQGMASRRGPWLVADGQDLWTGGWGT